MTPLIKSDSSSAPRIESIQPDVVLPGGEIEVTGANLGAISYRRPVAMVGELAAPVLMSRSKRIVLRIPEEAESGRLRILQNGAQSNSVDLSVASLLATGVHAVSSPAVDREGNIYATFSGTRGQETPVSVFRIERDGEMRPFLSGIMNATGLAVGDDGNLYVSSRQEGTVYRVTPAGAASVYAEGMGVATGIAFDAEGNLYVGDRSGTIFKIDSQRKIFVLATLEPSISAYHLSIDSEGTLFVTGPTLCSNDAIWAIDTHGQMRAWFRGLGRPQGLALSKDGDVYVTACLRGRRGLVRVTPAGETSLVVAGNNLVGVAFSPLGTTILATNEAVYDVDLGVEGMNVS